MSGFIQFICQHTEKFLEKVLKEPGKTLAEYSLSFGFDFDIDKLNREVIDRYHSGSKIKLEGLNNYFSRVKNKRDLIPFVNQIQLWKGDHFKDFKPNGIEIAALPTPSSSGEGVVVGCDHLQEHLLEPWWLEYKKFNDLPVAFADFGMSESSRHWCEARGKLFDGMVPGLPVFNRFCIPFVPFLKFFAINNAPFNKMIWLDLTCKVQKDLSSMFAFLKNSPVVVRPMSFYSHDIFLIPEKICYNRFPDERVFSTAVILAKKKSQLIKECLKVALNDTHYCPTPNTLFSRIVFMTNREPVFLDPLYNYSIDGVEKEKAFILSSKERIP